MFADRTSQGYLLLVDPEHRTLPTRAELAALARQELTEPAVAAELQLLESLIATEPIVFDPKLTDAAQQAPGTPRQTTDLLGLHIDLLPLREGDRALVTPEVLLDPVLTRALTPEERASLARRGAAILLRADYRSRHAVRGLRLLQRLVSIVASDRRALIHDPDTQETMGVVSFEARRLLPSLGNVADQVVVVPFADPRHRDGSVRLSTRGMRRFGSVDVELDDLPRDGATLQAATDFLYGLCYRLVLLGEFDASGYAVELPQEVAVTYDDVVQAYPSGASPRPPCEACPKTAEAHLVERPREPHDPAEHVVARVVAPRPRSDASHYDQRAWVLEVLAAVLGV